MENAQPNRLRILVADDDDNTLRLYQHVLSRRRAISEISSQSGKFTKELSETKEPKVFIPDFELLPCHQGDEAVNAVSQSLKDGRYFAIAFLDIQMPPGPDGIWTAEKIRALDPYIEIVLMTAYLGQDPRNIAHRILPVHKLLYIQKPLHPHEIYQFAVSLGAKWSTGRELRKIHTELEKRVHDRTVELVNTNERLEKEIEEREQAEEHSRQLLQAVETMQLGVMITDLNGKILYTNFSGSQMHGYQREELLGQPSKILTLPEFQSSPSLDQIKGWKGLIRESVSRRKDGTTFPVWLMSEIVKDAKEEPCAIVTSYEDITERKKTEEEIKFLAYHDVLTKLPNRKSFYLQMEQELARSRSRGGGTRRSGMYKWALLFLDLDRFKDVNDTLGHDVGDELLKLMATRIQNCLRQSDHIFRLGGDEFTIILTDLINDTDVAKVAKKIRENIAQPCYVKDHELYMTVSIGISIYPDDGHNVETLVRNADMAMYVAKGENEGYRFFAEKMHRRALKRMTMENHLRNAVQHKHFTLFYQPLVDTHNQLVGVEALIRWFHTELGSTSPSQFIPLAEETGHIIPIGKWVLFTACQQTQKWHEMGYNTLYVSVNLSPHQFKDETLIETIEKVLESTGFAPEYLKLEVTESGIMGDPEQAIVKMNILREKGIHFSIDDFGTGYSSLSYLKRFPIDTLKIDRSFVIDAPSNKDDQEIIKTIISMARNLRMDTVAEGIETKAQRDMLSSYGCHVMQGYYCGRPMPADKFEEFLQTHEHVYRKKSSQA